MNNTYEKRRFYEMATCSILVGLAFAGKSFTARHIVNQIGELWDEIEAQAPTRDKDKTDVA